VLPSVLALSERRHDARVGVRERARRLAAGLPRRRRATVA
jgi:hypothetical protein